MADDPRAFGRHGKHGRDGRDGRDGTDGKDGKPGLNGKDGRSIIGPKGDQGDPGISAKGDIGPQGPRGPRGEIGPMPRHEWEGSALRFEIAPGEWGKYTDLRGPPGRAGGGGGFVQVQGTGAGGDASVPYFIPAAQVYAVPIYRQALFARTIDAEGIVDLSGDLIMVN